jgi:cytochrome c-type biogenesis protein
MGDDLLMAAVSAVWLGILTSISPCPLATNIAAISYVSRKVAAPNKVFLNGLLYILGRTLTYTCIGVLLVGSMLSAPALSHFLQKYMYMALGPLLILVGMILLELISFNIGAGGISDKMKGRIDAMGAWGALLLGILFALSFCPVSAALFFGSLIPIAVRNESGIILPSLYGIATGLPVVVFAVLLAFGAQKVAQAYNKLAGFERWARRITGVVFIGVGVYYCLTNIFDF